MNLLNPNSGNDHRNVELTSEFIKKRKYPDLNEKKK